jgi:hypothetical protein
MSLARASVAWALCIFLPSCHHDESSPIRPSVQSARVIADRAQPAALAQIEVLALLHGGDGTDGLARLRAADLRVQAGADDHEAVDLKLAFPPDFDATIFGVECKAVSLINVGTTNGDLQPFCGQALDLVLTVESGTDWRSLASNYFEPYTLIVNCP